MLYEERKSRYKNLKNFNTVLQRCPRFWPLAPPRGMNPGVYSLGISEDPPRYLSSKFDASVRSDCWDISIWKTLTQCDGNGNANANANVDDRGDYNSSPCTSFRRAKKCLFFRNLEPLTLKAPSKICSRWHLFYLFIYFFNFSKKTSLDISCESSAKQTIHMKYQDLFSLRNYKKYFKMSSAAVVTGALRVNSLP